MTLSGAVRKMSWLRRPSQSSRFTRNAFASVAIVLSATASGCYTFGGGGFPPGLKTVAILPFDNQTSTPEVQRELGDHMRKMFHDRLGLRDAPEERADVVVTGVIGRYDADVPASVSANPSQVNVSRRRLQLILDVEILNTKTGKPLFAQKGLQSEGVYAEGREADGRKLAIESAVEDMIRKSQSQW